MTQPTPKADANALVDKLAAAKKALDTCRVVTADARRKWKQAIVFYDIEPVPVLPAGAPIPPVPETLPELTPLGKNIRDAVRAERAAQVAFDKVNNEHNTYLVNRGAR